MRFLKTLTALVMILTVSTGLALAQMQQQQPDVPSPDEISDDELVNFVDASDAIQPIQQEAQEELEKVIEDEGMEFQRFQQIMMAMQNPQMADQMDITAEEEQAIQAMQPKLMEINMEAENDIIQVIEENNLNVERYQAIYFSLQQHPELMERLDNLVGDEDAPDIDD